MKLRLADIAGWTGATFDGADRDITQVAIDSRMLKPGALYVALRGEHHDGHAFCAAAADAGATALLVEHPVEVDLPQLLVEDGVRALGQIASGVRGRSAATVVGITGSNGKTTVKTLVAAILSLHARAHVNAGNYNNEIGLPLSVITMPEATRYAVFEMGAGKPGDIAYLAGIARPQVALVNNVAPAHLERMGSLQGIARTKGALIEALPGDGIAIINADDAFAADFTMMAGARRIIRFGLGGGVDVRGHVDAGHATWRLEVPAGSVTIQWSLSGLHNVRNALAAAAIAIALGVPLVTIKLGLESVKPVHGRLEQRIHPGGAVVIDDSYNANPGSFAAAIATLAQRPGRRVLVMGDMKELGPAAAELHAQTGALAAISGIDALHAVGELSASAVLSFGANGFLHPQQAALVEALRPQLRAGTTLLVKGSRSSAMDKVVAALFDEAEAPHAA